MYIISILHYLSDLVDFDTNPLYYNNLLRTNKAIYLKLNVLYVHK